MSSLIFCTDEQQALIATDTLAVSPDGSPSMFTSKALYLPHLRTLVAGTGAGGFLDRWFLHINTRLLVDGIENLNHHAPSLLSEIWLAYRKSFASELGITTTIYHFGISETTGSTQTYAYRSSNDFTSEPLPYGLSRKPDCSVPELYQLPKDLKSMMRDQRTRQSMLPASERVYIGGEILVHQLSREGCVIYTLDRFEDCFEDAKLMLKKHQQS